MSSALHLVFLWRVTHTYICLLLFSFFFSPLPLGNEIDQSKVPSLLHIPPLGDFKPLLDVFWEIFEVLRRQHCVFFVDLSCITKDVEVILALMELALFASRNGWYLVLAASSGGGWKGTCSDNYKSAITHVWRELCITCTHVTSTNFTHEEAEIFIKTLVLI